jgi:tetratricopeptide (TPR) repeat protein
MQRAIRLDPLLLVIRWTLAHFLYFSRRFDEAIDEARKALDLDPNFGPARQVLGTVYAHKGMHEASMTELTEAGRRAGPTPNYLGSLGYSFAGAGNRERALAIIRELQDLFPKPYTTSYWVAMIYANLKDAEEAWHWLDIGYKERAAHLVYSRVDPRFDNLRSDPRFENLLQRLNYPKNIRDTYPRSTSVPS